MGFSHSNGCRLRDSHRSPRLQERSAAWSGWCFWGVNICLHPRGCTLALGPPLRSLPGLEASPERGAWGPLAGTRAGVCGCAPPQLDPRAPRRRMPRPGPGECAFPMTISRGPEGGGEAHRRVWSWLVWKMPAWRGLRIPGPRQWLRGLPHLGCWGARSEGGRWSVGTRGRAGANYSMFSCCSSPQTRGRPQPRVLCVPRLPPSPRLRAAPSPVRPPAPPPGAACSLAC